MSEVPSIAVVTGATGFLGRALCTKLLESGFVVRAAARHQQPGPWSEFVAIELPDRVPEVLFERATVVFHLAGRAHAIAESRSEVAFYRDVNARGAEEVGKAAKRAGVHRFVFMSTVKVFGEPGPGLVREDQPGIATDPYGRSKARAEDALMAMRTADFEVVILRPALVYGPGAKGNLDSLVRLLRGGRMPPLPHIENRRSMVGINDLIDATVTAGTAPGLSGKSYTVTDGRVYSTTEIVEGLASAMGITRPPRIALPLWALHGSALVGDAGRRVTGRRFPFDSEMLKRLCGNAEYEATALSLDTGFHPRQTLSDLAGSMVRPTPVPVTR